MYREISLLLMPPNSFNLGMSENKPIEKQNCYWPVIHLRIICIKVSTVDRLRNKFAVDRLHKGKTQFSCYHIWCKC